MLKLLALSLVALVSFAAPPSVGTKAPDFTLTSLEGKSVTLSKVTAQAPTALIVLRGFPGYQCPVCNRQVQDLIKNGEEFAKAGIQVLMVYPGPSDVGLQGKANEFMTGKTLPAGFTMVLDPDYTFTNQYSLRWDAPKETAYPSTFLLGKDRTIYFSKISDTHGGRTTAAEVLAEFAKHKH